ncbi:MAG: hypothetical protein L0Y56_18525, partial [Nitrospira sp.]|nr:hypothetical protein [Nitrospira sp.]
DRRNVHNFWREWKEGGYDFQGRRERGRKVSNEEVVKYMQQQWIQDVGVSVKEMKQRVEGRFSMKVSETALRKAAQEVEVIPILRAVHRQLEKGERTYKQGWLLKRMFEGMQSQEGIRESESREGFQWSQYARCEIMGEGLRAEELKGVGQEARPLREASSKLG